MSLNEYFDFNISTGKIYWRKLTGRNAVKIGDEAGSPNSKGYLQVKVLGKVYKSHRLIWFLHFGHWPKNQIDHINNIKTDNRICNLREVTNVENCQNKKFHKNHLLGTTRRGNKWSAQIRIKGKKTTLGTFETQLEAHQKYMEAYRDQLSG